MNWSGGRGDMGHGLMGMDTYDEGRCGSNSRVL